MKRTEFHFSRRYLRERIGWNETQLRVHIARLVELEYLLVHRGGRGQSFVYELLYEKSGADKPALFGLVDVATLTVATMLTSRSSESTSRAEEMAFAASSRPLRGEIAVTSRAEETSESVSADAGPQPSRITTSLDALLRAERKRGVARSRGGNGRDHAPLAWRPDVLRRLARRRNT
jgi:hypothetical protein